MEQISVSALTAPEFKNAELIKLFVPFDLEGDGRIGDAELVGVV